MRAKNMFYKYGMALLSACLMVRLTAGLHGLMDTADTAGKLRILADAFTIPGVTLIMLWILVRVSAEGIFDGIAYALSWSVSALFPGISGSKNEAYAEYLERKNRDRASGKGISFLWHTGAVFLIPAAMLTVMYYFV